MLNLIITLSLLAFNCTESGIEANPYHTESAICNDSYGVVFRSTQKLYCADVNEYIYFYSSGKVVICTDTTRIEGTYSLEDNREGISININGYNIYCRASLDRSGNLISITYNGLRYNRR